MKKIIFILLALVMSLTVKAQVSDYQNWMANLDDNAFICQLSIPGAHDACSSSFSGWGAIGAAVAGKDQSKSIQQMLPLGVRLFDIRPNNQLNIYHGILQTSYTFNGVMGELRDYVIAHPTEFCIVFIRHEEEGDSGNDDFASKMQTALASFSEYLVDFRPNLTVGEARGKILFLSRNAYNGPIRGGMVTDWRDNQSDINNMLGAHYYGPETHKCSLWSQGYYSYTDVSAKKAVIEAMLNKSKQLAGKYDYTWVINSLDGYPSDQTYTNSLVQNNAKNCNPYLQQLLASGNYNGPVGFVFMDYCCDGNNSGYYGLSLTKELINHNFRYTMSKQGDPIYDGNGNLFVAPKGCDMMWDAKVLRLDGTSLSGPTGWYNTDFDDSEWETRRFPTANSGAGASYYSLWNETSNTLFIRREFYVDHDPTIDTYKLYVRHDDGFVAYLNGSQFQSENGWVGSFNVFSIPSSILKVGRNVLAIRQEQGDGGAYFDCGVLRIEGTYAPLKLTGTDWQSFVAPGHNLNFGTTAVKAYKIVEINENNTSARLEEVTIVPADQAVVVRSDNGAATYNIPVTQSIASFDDNLMKAATSSFTVTEANTIYCLAKKNGKTGFYPVAVGVTIPKGKGYLDLSGSNVKAACIFLNSDDDATGIEDLNVDLNLNETIYNLAGQRLSKPQHGINIIGGKKIAY
ncbi:MAG: hypothetical protein J6V92_04505 [Bacteroidaceae bacterium]|nr:hypothetical protein [Bacteroidaceae bacterium]